MGFKEIIGIKSVNTNIGRYFQHFIISEIVGVNKPDPAILEHALNLAGRRKKRKPDDRRQPGG